MLYFSRCPMGTTSFGFEIGSACADVIEGGAEGSALGVVIGSFGMEKPTIPFGVGQSAEGEEALVEVGLNSLQQRAILQSIKVALSTFSFF